MPTILELIRNGATKEEIQEKIRAGATPVPLFTAAKELGNKSLYLHLYQYKKINKWTLEDFIDANAINLNEVSEDKKTIVQHVINDNDLDNVKMLLLKEVTLFQGDYDLAKGNVKEFLDYQPGKNEENIFKYCSKRTKNKNYIQALIYDQADTTDDESSDAEMFGSEELSEKEIKEYNKYQKEQLADYTKNPNNTDCLSLVAARGVHFSRKYFSPKIVEKILEDKEEKHSTFSQSTLFDAGYTADDEVDETNAKIFARHHFNLNFIQKLKESADKKEKSVKSSPPPASRNKQQFKNHYFRFMQVYINSYNRMFNLGFIITDFGFDTKHNPLISASWNFSKAAMYASGYRFEWENRGIRKDPHYRRSTGKPKHPNMGYIDIFVFTPTYVKNYSFDRQLMCRDEQIKLNSMHRDEAEIIFYSMIPKEYFFKRYFISLPTFNKPYTTQFSRYDINRNDIYIKRKNAILALPANKNSDEYKDFINGLTEKSADKQARIIEKTIQVRLFKGENKKVVVYDHGDKLDTIPFKLK